MAAIIMIQCQFRIYHAKKRIRLQIRESVKHENAALAIQRNWYYFRNEFSSFFLVSAYRARRIVDEEEKKIAKHKSCSGMVDKIQRLFRRFVGDRFYVSAVMIQKSYRRLMGKRDAAYLRRKKVAGRKIRFWMKFAMKRR